MNDKNFKIKAVSGVKWTSFLSASNAIIGVIYRIILVWLMLPEEYAYIAILSLFIGISDLINNLGVGEAVLQKDNVTNSQLSSIFYFNILISSLSASLLYLSAPLIENFYNYSDLILVLQLTSVTFVLNGSSSIFRVKLQKELEFKWFTIASLTKLISDILFTISFIVLGFGIWGYLFGTILSTLIYAIQLAYFCFRHTNMKIKIHFKIMDIIPFLKFGISISLKQIFTYLTLHVDELIIGRFLSPDVLGIYFFAKDFIKKPQNLITQAFSQIMLPVFARIKNSRIQLANLYNNTTKTISYVAFPLFVGMAVTASLYVPLLFGPEWNDSIPAIRVFSITGLLLVLTANFSTSLLYAINKPNAVLFIEVLTNLVYYVFLFLFARQGVSAILLTYLAYIILKTLILQFYVGRNLGYSLISYISSLRNIIFITLVMGTAVIILIPILQPLNLIYQFVIATFLGVCIYLGMSVLFEKKMLRQVINLLKIRGV